MVWGVLHPNVTLKSAMEYSIFFILNI